MIETDINITSLTEITNMKISLHLSLLSQPLTGMKQLLSSRMTSDFRASSCHWVGCSVGPIECATKWISPHARGSMKGLSLGQQSVTDVWCQCTCLTVVAQNASLQVGFAFYSHPCLSSYIIGWCSRPYKCNHLFGLQG